MSDADRVKKPLTAFIEYVMRRVDYHAAYPARVVVQNADGTLDVVPDSPKLPSMTNVPIRYGVPGVTAKVRKDSRVIVEFAAGDPSKPYATVWESASVAELTVKADVVRLADGDMPLARQGDLVVVQLPQSDLAAPGKPTLWLPAPDPTPTARAYGEGRRRAAC